MYVTCSSLIHLAALFVRPLKLYKAFGGFGAFFYNLLSLLDL